eukprot:scaffold94074_cov33-Tisochrysis_lutea.AAC.3
MGDHPLATIEQGHWAWGYGTPDWLVVREAEPVLRDHTRIIAREFDRGTGHLRANSRSYDV